MTAKFSPAVDVDAHKLIVTIYPGTPQSGNCNTMVSLQLTSGLFGLTFINTKLFVTAYLPHI